LICRVQDIYPIQNDALTVGGGHKVLQCNRKLAVQRPMVRVFGVEERLVRIAERSRVNHRIAYREKWLYCAITVHVDVHP
jgi:hypothetical protein